jgi:hypothetical protein
MRLKISSDLVLKHIQKTALLFFWVIFVTLVVTVIIPDFSFSEEYEMYINYINTYPDQKQEDYADELNGITHDRSNWYISQNLNRDQPKIWRIPVSSPLTGIYCNVNGIDCQYLRDFSAISMYKHVGDIDHYYYLYGLGYLVLPLEDGGNPAIAIVESTNFQFVAYAEIPGHTNAAWVAVNPVSGDLYTSSADRPGWVYVYDVAWSVVQFENKLQLTKIKEFRLEEIDGTLIDLDPQGGAFSESGKLLYINNGYYGHYSEFKDGISVFDMHTADEGYVKRIAHSSRDKNLFWYGYDDTCEVGNFSCEEPEGLTVWDLDDSIAPREVWGQLHVLLLDNDDYFYDKDDVYIRHYTNKIYVDGQYGGAEQGDPLTPYDTVNEANSMAWDGSRMIIENGSYPEATTFEKRMEVLSRGGTVVIGK